MELYAELAGAGLVVACPPLRLAGLLGGHALAERGAKPGDTDARPSLAGLRAELTRSCILPLLSAYVHDRCAPLRGPTSVPAQAPPCRD